MCLGRLLRCILHEPLVETRQSGPLRRLTSISHGVIETRIRLPWGIVACTVGRNPIWSRGIGDVYHIKGVSDVVSRRACLGYDGEDEVILQ